ncbi:MAG TPA: wax ester/triacylglycerol synthase family O-acyltransferase [Myxococcota bacterium]|nr:wax ester/triacylglycerol synthase family O-acyltransferase [Myxococcota bacterium]
MQQLTGTDALFLHLDSPRFSTGATIVFIYDQSARAKPLRFKEILQHLEKRVPQLPVLRRKLHRVPFDLDRPYWVDAPDFEIEHHVHHVRLPHPGDWRQFCILAARLTTPHFDLTRPLWEMYVVEGLDHVAWLPEGSFAILLRVHHAAVDGTSALRIMEELHDESPEGRKERRAPTRQVPEGPPGLATMLLRSGWNNARAAFEVPRAGVRIASQFARSGDTGGDATGQVRARDPVPKTRFNVRISPYRVFESRLYDLRDVRAYKARVSGATVNDAVLAICGGAMRRYLLAKSELPKESLVALVPVNTRRRDVRAGAGGNDITPATAPIHTEIADPIERLVAVREATAGLKAFLDAVGAKEMTDLTRHAPEALLAFAGRMASLLRFDAGALGRPLFNLGISNVPGPQKPLYLRGARLRHLSCVAPIADGMGLMIGVASYDGGIGLFPTACRDVVPDPEFLASCLDESVEEIRGVLAAEPSRTVGP